MSATNATTADLIERLKPWDFDAAKAAAEELGRRRATEAVPALIETLFADDWWDEYDLHLIVALALARIGDARALPAFVKILEGPYSNGHCWAVAQALAGFETPEGRATLTRRLEQLAAKAQSDEPMARHAAVEELGEIGLSQCAPTLLAALKDRSFLVRETAADALGAIGQSMPALALKDQIIAALIELLADTYTLHESLPRVCDHAAKALMLIGTTVARSAVEQWRKMDREA